MTTRNPNAHHPDTAGNEAAQRSRAASIAAVQKMLDERREDIRRSPWKRLWAEIKYA